MEGQRTHLKEQQGNLDRTATSLVQPTKEALPQTTSPDPMAPGNEERLGVYWQLMTNSTPTSTRPTVVLWSDLWTLSGAARRSKPKARHIPPASSAHRAERGQGFIDCWDESEQGGSTISLLRQLFGKQEPSQRPDQRGSVDPEEARAEEESGNRIEEQGLSPQAIASFTVRLQDESLRD